MEPIEWAAVVVVALIVLAGILVALKDRIGSWLFGSGPRPNASMRLGSSGPAVAPPAGRRFVVELTRRDDNNPIPAQNVTFTILPGDDGTVTSRFSTGGTSATGVTDTSGQAWVTIQGTADGADRLRAAVALSDAEMTYETLQRDP